MIRLYVLAALATVAVPVVVPYRLTSQAFPSAIWLPGVLLCGEVLLTAVILRAIYPNNDFIRCITFGGLFVLLRLVFCLTASVIDPDADDLWISVSYEWRNILVPPLTYMYAAWWMAAAQYVALLLWLPAALEMALPGVFRPRAAIPAPWAASRPEARAPQETSRPGDLQAKTFADLEKELTGYRGLLSWMIFSPDRLPVWDFGDHAAVLESSPEIARRMGEVCKPLFGPDWGGDLRQSLVQTEAGYWLLTVLPGGFLFSSLWRIERPEGQPIAALAEVLERVDRWLSYRFAEVV